MYDKQNGAQRIALEYGARMRYIKGIQSAVSTVKSGTFSGVFTDGEIAQIDSICLMALARSETRYHHERGLPENQPKHPRQSKHAYEGK